MDMKYVDVWNDFYNEKTLFKFDGIHIISLGRKKLLERICTNLSNHNQEN